LTDFYWLVKTCLFWGANYPESILQYYKENTFFCDYYNRYYLTFEELQNLKSHTAENFNIFGQDSLILGFCEEIKAPNAIVINSGLYNFCAKDSGLFIPGILEDMEENNNFIVYDPIEANLTYRKISQGYSGMGQIKNNDSCDVYFSCKNMSHYNVTVSPVHGSFTEFPFLSVEKCEFQKFIVYSHNKVNCKFTWILIMQ